MAEAAFSEDGKYYSSIGQDGRLRIWDTETNVLKQEYTPDLHLKAPPSCLQWITVAVSKSPSKKDNRKSSVSEQEAQCIAVGTTSGKILIYSVAQAKVQTVLEEHIGRSQDQKITALDWNRKDGLFSCNKSNYICEWTLGASKIASKYHVNLDSKNKAVSTISAIKLIPHTQETSAKYIITASWQLRVWRLHNGEATVLKCLGHNASKQSILAIAATSEKTWAIEGSQTERLLAFWDVTVTSDVALQMNGHDEDGTPHKRKKKKSLSSAEKEDVKTLTIPTYNFVLEDAPKMIDVAVKEEADVKLTLAAVTRSGVMHYYSHTLNGASAKPIKPNLTVHITTGEATPLPLQCCRLSPNLQVGYTHGPTLLFEKITPDLSSKTQVLIRGETKKKKVKGGTPNEINKVARPVTKIQSTWSLWEVLLGNESPGAKVEVPMERRLANLTLETAAKDKTAVNQNLTRLLIQGLQSRDTNILEMVLHDSSRAAAARTTAQLPAEFIPPLLDYLATLATKRTATCATVCVWISAILRSHAALLLATMNAHNAERLGSLLATFTNRRAHLCQLLNVSGRIQLTLAQRAEKQTAPAEEPVIDYNDTSDEEMEVDRQSGSGASWDEQDFDDDDDDEDSDDEDRPQAQRRRRNGRGSDSDSGGE
ncbi:LOW QUALITY PROTEIN: WD repeat-containing protein 43 [Leguminivora glycinivorella]|uniref:LOW QUALITY PROTEIN: WD repeat-containing protein 43 n=1 Tax=Leguminivora glycinivorella TaxID=1035111 RepID=UPI0020101960|nr:LOW QUALITY PROTEIN: WD repeat-containing protein 43 [Leguminivora glycinivorella]